METVSIQPFFIPPFRFGFVDEGLSRGAYPTLRNFRYISRLRLSTIISLVPESPTGDLIEYANAAGITIIHLPVLRSAPLNAQLMNLLLNALRVCLDIDTHPSIYVHCLDGRRITGLFMLLLRKLQGWQPAAAFAEYWKYQTVMKPGQGVLEMKAATAEIGKFLNDFTEPIYIPHKIPRWLWGGDRSKGFPSSASPSDTSPAHTTPCLGMSMGMGMGSSNNSSAIGSARGSGRETGAAAGSGTGEGQAATVGVMTSAQVVKMYGIVARDDAIGQG